MLDRIVKLNETVNSILQRSENKKHADKRLSSLEITHVQELCTVLKPFYIVTEKLSSQKFATQSMIIPALSALYNSVTFKF